MKTTDFSKSISSTRLAENLEKQFGVRVDLDKYGREQLEDIRNILRTRVFQQEATAGVNDLLTNETYQKDKAMLELLNIRIKEMLGEDIKKLRDRMIELSEGKKGVRQVKHPQATKGTKPDFLDMDKDGDKQEPMKKAIKDKKMKESSDAGDHKPPKETSRTVKMKKQGGGDVDVSVRKVQGWQSQKADKNADKEKDLDEGKSCSEGHTKMTKGCKECAGMWESKKAKPDFLDMDKDGDKQEPMKKAAKDKGGSDSKEGKKGMSAKQQKFFGKKKTVKENDHGYLMNKESFDQFKHNVRFVNESIDFLLKEDEEGKAKTITAAGDMVNDFTSWMQRVGQYQTKAIIELSDEIRSEFGPAEAEAFKQTVGPALSSTLETLTQQREAISNAVAQLATGSAPTQGMGMEPEMPVEPGMDMSAPDEMNPEPTGDEFSAADAAAGGSEVAGREMRESKFARKLQESHNIISKLAV